MLFVFLLFLYSVVEHFVHVKCLQSEKSMPKGVTNPHGKNPAPALPETPGLESSLYFHILCVSLQQVLHL